MPKSTVSRKVSELEERLKARLAAAHDPQAEPHGRRPDLLRVLRADRGRDRRRRARSERLQATPRGLLRVTAPVNVAFLGPIVERLPQTLPRGSARAVLHRARRGSRGGTLRPRHPRRSARRLVADRAKSRHAQSGFSSPHPRTSRNVDVRLHPTTLKDHDCLLFGAGLRQRQPSSRKRRQVRARERFAPHAGERHGRPSRGRRSRVSASRCFPRFAAWRICAPADSSACFATGRAPPTPVQVVYPSTRHLSPKVKTFIDHLQERMTPPPWELGPMP